VLSTVHDMVVQRRDGPRRLCEDDDANDDELDVETDEHAIDARSS